MTLRDKKALLVLADGMVYEGTAFGAEGEAVGEVVFNTSLTGYQEILTDPSYSGQIVTMTYPMIGNYGVTEEDQESEGPYVEGFVVKECSTTPSNWRCQKSLDLYMKEHGVVGIQGVDTRALTRHIRDHGAQMGIISSAGDDREILVDKVRSAPTLIGRDLVSGVTCRTPYVWEGGRWRSAPPSDVSPGSFMVVAYDFGIKRNILRSLVDVGCRVVVVPARTPAEDLLAMNPDGICFSNGPGDPEAVTYAIENARKLIGKKPILGICLGHQIIGLALGGKTFKLKFGHHGGNHPVKELATGRVEITVQNHGFAVDMDSLRDRMILTHLNLNDGTVEGMRHRDLPLFSVQYHPEASPGPQDASYLFRQFVEMMAQWREDV